MGNVTQLELTEIPDVMTTGEVASLFGVNFKTILRWVKVGDLKATRLPGKRGDHRFAKIDVLEFCERHNLALFVPRSPECPQVLIADDDALVSRSIERIIRANGKWEVICAGDGYQAGVLMGLRSPSLVFLDLQMPGADGFEVLRFMRSLPEFKSIPVVVLSALGEERLASALAAGATAIIPKPFTHEQILAALALVDDRRKAVA